MAFKTRGFMLNWCVAIAASVALLVLFCAPASGLRPPTREQIEQYRKDGTLAEHVRMANELGNNKMDSGLVARSTERLSKLVGLPFKPMSPPPGWVSSMPIRGTVKILALLIEFNDYTHNYGNTKEVIANNLFGSGSPASPPYDSLRSFYLRSSYGQLSIEGNVLGWTAANIPRSSVAETTEGREQLIMNALNYWDAQGHDFSQYDNNGDGTIDYFMVFWAGPTDTWASFWWPYATEFGAYPDFRIDGKALNKYTWQSDSPSSCYSGAQFNPGVVIHETGHALGLPDYYDYDDLIGPRGGTGGLDVMDWCGEHNSFSKFVLDWITPTVFTGGTHFGVQLRASDAYPDAVIAMPEAADGQQFGEYFIIENRNEEGNDAFDPGSGLAIWHVDARIDQLGNYLYNNSSTAHKLIRLMEADGLEEIEQNNGVNGADFYVNGTMLTPTTTPNSYRYDGTDTGITISNISAPGGVMTFDLEISGFTISSVTAPDPSHIDVKYNQNVHYSASATDTSNYTIDNGIGNPTAAQVQADGKTVRLTISGTIPECIKYSMNVSNVRSNGGVLLYSGSSPVDVVRGNVISMINSDVTLTPAGGPYCAVNDVVISKNITLTIQAGTTIKIYPHAADADVYLEDLVDFMVQGKLLIQGTASAPVVMTSAATSPVAGDWGEILFGSDMKDGTSISYLQSSYSTTGIYDAYSASSTVQNSTFSDCSYRCVYVWNSYSFIKNNSFSRCGYYCLHLVDTSADVINNSFTDTNISQSVIAVEGGSPVIQGNDITGCASGRYCLQTWNSGAPVIRNNRFHDTENGIYSDSSPVIAGNDFDTLSFCVVVTANSANATLKDNNMINSTTGIAGGAGTSVNGTHNRFFNNVADSGGGGTFSVLYPLTAASDRRLALSSIVLKTDSTYATDLGASIPSGQTLYIQLNGTDGDAATANQTVVRVYSTSNTAGVFVTLTETAVSSGIYRGTALLAAASDQAASPVKIEAASGNTVTVVSVRDSGISDSTSVTAADSSPPDQSNWSPAKNSTITTTAPSVTFTTTENADCKWALADNAYSSMTGDCTGDGTTSQTCAASGLPQGAATLYVSCKDTWGNEDNASSNENISYTVDTVPPVQSNWSPAGGSTITTAAPSITFTTGENADCKWALTDIAYSSMTGDCTGDGTTSQTCAVSGLAQGAVTVYAACRDSAGNSDNAGTNTHLSYTVDSLAPVQSNWSPAKGSTLATASPTITFTTGESGDCKWALTDVGYASMTGDCTGDGTTSQTCAVSGLAQGAATVYAACRDALGNANGASTNEHISYVVDTAPPNQSNWTPAKGATIGSASPTVTFTTTEIADCKWSLTDQAYADMTGDCTGDGTTSQVCAASGLPQGAATVYTACRDALGNADTADTNEDIGYTVGAAPPEQSNWSPAKGTAMTGGAPTVTFMTSANSDCKWSLTDQAYADMTGDCTGDGTTSQTCAVSGLAQGAATVYTACRDELGNVDTADSNEHIGYIVDDTSPSDVAAVRDGLGADADFSSSTVSLSANWDDAVDAQSGIGRYWYAVGTSAGASDTVQWTDNGSATSASVPGLTLSGGVVYYFTVKAENAAGLMSGAANSDGITIDVSAPGVVTSFTAAAGDVQVSLSWVNPGDVDFAGVRLVRNTTRIPAGATDGVQIYDGATASYRDGGLINGKTYYYAAFAYDNLLNISPGAGASATPRKSTPSIMSGWNAFGASRQGATLTPGALFGQSKYYIIQYENGVFSSINGQTTLNLQIGKVYWIYSESEIGELYMDGSDYTQASKDISLASGWNMFSNPYPDSLDWNSSHAALTCGGSAKTLPAVYGFKDGVYSAVTPGADGRIAPWAGYFIHAPAEQCTMRITK